MPSKRHSLYVRRDRLAGGLMGLLIGDALGVPYEFQNAVRLPPNASLDFTPPDGFLRSHGSVPPGTWSDDGAQALCLLESLAAHDGFELADFAQRLVRWQSEGHLAVDGRVFDIGMQTQRALERLRAGAPPERSGGSGEGENGNGSLMRVLPLALWYQGPTRDLMILAARQSVVTHGHPRSQVACALYCLWARAEFDYWHKTPAERDLWAADVLRKEGPTIGLSTREIEFVLHPAHLDRAQGTGYVVDALWSAKAALESASDYASAVRQAVAYGNDTDTTAAIAGGLAGIRYGLYGIPLDWRQRLRGQELVRPLLRALVIHGAGHEGEYVSAGAGAAALRSTDDAADRSTLDVMGAGATDNAPKILVPQGPRRTSESHPLKIGAVPVPSGGAVGITFCPGKKQPISETGSWDRDLDTDLDVIRQWGATHLLTLVAPHELVELGVSNLGDRAAAHGLIWHHAPIWDGHIPGMVPAHEDASKWFAAVWPEVFKDLRLALAHGERVVVHCKGGLGRAGTAAALLVASQWPEESADQVIDRVRQARPNAIETVLQEGYVRQQVQRLRQTFRSPAL